MSGRRALLSGGFVSVEWRDVRKSPSNRQLFVQKPPAAGGPVRQTNELFHAREYVMREIHCHLPSRFN